MTNNQQHIEHSLNTFYIRCGDIRSNPLPHQVLLPDPALASLPPTPLKNVSLRFKLFHFFNLSCLSRAVPTIDPSPLHRYNAPIVVSCSYSSSSACPERSRRVALLFVSVTWSLDSNRANVCFLCRRFSGRKGQAADSSMANDGARLRQLAAHSNDEGNGKPEARMPARAVFGLGRFGLLSGLGISSFVICATSGQHAAPLRIRASRFQISLARYSTPFLGQPSPSMQLSLQGIS